MYSSQFDVLGVGELGFWVWRGVLPRMWVMVEKAHRLIELVNLRI